MPRPRGGYPARSRRIRDWGVGPRAGDEAVGASGKLLWTEGSVSGTNCTIIRTRGLVTVLLKTAAAAGDGFFGAHGIYMMTEDAFAVGVTAALDPLSDASSDMWLWHSYFDVRAVTATIADGVNATSAFSRVIIDSKAMRKDFDPDRVMVGVSGFTESGTATCDVNADSRQLCLR